MSHSIDQRARLDGLLSNIEDAIFDAPDHDLHDDLQATPETVRQIREMIEAQLDAVRPSDAGKNNFVEKTIPVKATDRRRMLLNLLVVQPKVPSTIRAAFSGDQEPTDDEVDQMVQKLWRLGLLGNGKATKKK